MIINLMYTIDDNKVFLHSKMICKMTSDRIFLYMVVLLGLGGYHMNTVQHLLSILVVYGSYMKLQNLLMLMTFVRK